MNPATGTGQTGHPKRLKAATLRQVTRGAAPKGADGSGSGSGRSAGGRLLARADLAHLEPHILGEGGRLRLLGRRRSAGER
jgi:hypothetical protein